MLKLHNSNSVVEFADALAHELVDYGEDNDIAASDLLMGVVMAERLLRRVYPGPRKEANNVVLEGHATFDALTKERTPQDIH